MIIEWNEYLDYEIGVYAEAIMSALPKIGGSNFGGNHDYVTPVITDPDEKSKIFDILGAMSNNG